MSHGPWAQSSGTTRMKALLLPSSGLNFLRMPSCHRIRHGRGGVVQWGGDWRQWGCVSHPLGVRGFGPTGGVGVRLRIGAWSDPSWGWGGGWGFLLELCLPTYPTRTPGSVSLRGLRWGSPSHGRPSLRRRPGLSPGGVGWSQQRLRFPILWDPPSFCPRKRKQIPSKGRGAAGSGGCSWGSSDPTAAPRMGMCPRIPRDAAGGEHGPAGRASAATVPRAAKIRTRLIPPPLIPSRRAPSAQTSGVCTPLSIVPCRGESIALCQHRPAGPHPLPPPPPAPRTNNPSSLAGSANERQPGATQPVPTSSRCHQQ